MQGVQRVSRKKESPVTMKVQVLIIRTELTKLQRVREPGIKTDLDESESLGGGDSSVVRAPDS